MSLQAHFDAAQKVVTVAEGAYANAAADLNTDPVKLSELDAVQAKARASLKKAALQVARNAHDVATTNHMKAEGAEKPALKLELDTAKTALDNAYDDAVQAKEEAIAAAQDVVNKTRVDLNQKQAEAQAARWCGRGPIPKARQDPLDKAVANHTQAKTALAALPGAPAPAPAPVPATDNGCCGYKRLNDFKFLAKGSVATLSAVLSIILAAISGTATADAASAQYLKNLGIAFGAVIAGLNVLFAFSIDVTVAASTKTVDEENAMLSKLGLTGDVTTDAASDAVPLAKGQLGSMIAALTKARDALPANSDQRALLTQQLQALDAVHNFLSADADAENPAKFVPPATV
jgi:hypothetical protein